MAFRFVAIGEILWDELPGGRQLGGAPANAAFHAQSLGADAAIVSRVANDADGDAIRNQLQAAGLATDFLQTNAPAPTGRVTVRLDAAGVPVFTIHEPAAWDFLEANADALKLVGAADAVCFGSLAQRNEIGGKAVRELVAASRRNTLRIFDINLRPPFVDRGVILASLHLANALKLNDSELPILAGMLGLDAEPQTAILALAKRFQLRWIALTRGEKGSVIFSNGEWSDLSGTPIEVIDTVGAGDSFTAAAAIGFLAGWPLAVIHQRAARIAAFVCSQPGATPALPEELRSDFLAANG